MTEENRQKDVDETPQRETAAAAEESAETEAAREETPDAAQTEEKVAEEEQKDGAAEKASEKEQKEEAAREASEEEQREEATQETSEEEQREDAAEKPSEEKTEEKKKDKAESLIEELNDRIRRQMAEFDNFRKRSEKEKSGMFEMGARNVIEQILPIVDNFERGLAGVPEEAKEDPFVQGMDKVYRQMTEALEKLGVKPIEAVGCTFDPEFHNAVMHAEDEEKPDNTIVEEFLKGYTYRDHVVRHSMVKVVN